MKDVIRKVVLAALAVLIAVLVFTTAQRAVTEAPSFSVPVGSDEESNPRSLEIECPPIGPGTAALSVSLYDDHPGHGDLNEIMSGEAFAEYVKYHEIKTEDMTAQDFEVYEEFREEVRENTLYYCGILRENQQTGLIMLYGQGLLLLVLVGIAATLTAPRPTRAESVQS